jgi:hypothetical protein
MGMISNGAASGSMQAGRNSKKLLQAAQADASSSRAFEQQMLEHAVYQSQALSDIRTILREIASRTP